VALQGLAREIGPVHALARRHRCDAIERFFAARRAAFGVRTLSARRPTAAALERLRAGGWIAALADRATLKRRKVQRGPSDAQSRGLVQVDRAPLLIARRAAAQVLAGVAWRAGDGVAEVRFHPTFTLERGPGGLEIPQAEERLQHFFDAHIRAHPTQWYEWDRTILAGPAGGGLGSTSR
jgi:lauroyl/myristoyl acyltransferase